MRIGIAHLPGGIVEDASRAVELAGATPVPLWYASAELPDLDGVIIPSGHTYGNYLRPGALAAASPLLRAVADAAADRLPVLGLGTGFAVLCELGLLPGALVANASLRFAGGATDFDLVKASTAWTFAYLGIEDPLTLPVNSAAGQYIAGATELDRLEGEGQVVLRCAGEDLTGSARGIAGITNATNNVVGIVPAAQNAVEERYGPSADGLGFFASLGASSFTGGGA